MALAGWVSRIPSHELAFRPVWRPTEKDCSVTRLDMNRVCCCLALENLSARTLD